MKNNTTGFPESSAIFKAVFPPVDFKTEIRKNRERRYRLLMIYSRAVGLYTVLQDVIPNWSEKQRLEVEEAVKEYIKRARENDWREAKKSNVHS